MSNVIKVNHIIGDIIKTIYIFAGNININNDYPWNLHDDESSPIFNSEELNVIKTLNINVVIVNGYLHRDDTISTIKNKFIKYTNLKLSTAEIYLFGIIRKRINPAILYDQLTQTDSLKLTKEGICQMLLNIIESGCEKLNTHSGCSLLESDKDSFEYEDLMDIENIDWDSPVDYTIPIGQIIVKKKQYPFIANPYNCNVIDKVLSRDVEQLVTTQKSNLLFEYGKLCNNNIYVCFAEDVLQYTNPTPVPDDYILNIYFPVLVANYNIKTIEELIKKKIQLLEDQDKIINESFDLYNERVDLLYDIFHNKTSNLKYDDKSPGITKIKFIIHPTQTIQIPLELIFKLVHSTIDVPMVKYNPGGGQDNIYRFYTDASAKNGKKIPYLYTKNKNTRSKILYISKRIAKKKRVAYYIEYEVQNTNYAIDCEFESNGNVVVTILLDKINTVQQIEEVIKQSINPPLLNKIKVYLEQSGYTYQTFSGLDAPNIEIIDFTYTSVLKLKKYIQIQRYLSCLSTVFTITDTTISKEDGEIKMMYKRVSNYNELDGVETFINDMVKKGAPMNEIIKKIISNFNLDESKAIEYYSEWASQINLATDLFSNKTITIRTNTGFPVSIIQNKVNFKTTFQISLVNDIKYIDSFFIYIDSMIRLILDDDLTTIQPERITNICKGVEQISHIVEEELTNYKINVAETEEDIDSFLNIFATQREDSAIEEYDAIVNEGETKMKQSLVSPDIQFGVVLDSSDEDGSDYDGFDLEEMSLDSPSHDRVEEESDEDFGDIKFNVLNEPNKTVSVEKPVFEEKNGESKMSRKHSPAKVEIEADLEGVIVKGANNIFIKRKEELQPELFLKKNVRGYASYSRSCQSVDAKQPMMLTTTEKDYIDKKDTEFGTKSYDEHITYGTGDEKYHYICPRFWCLGDENNKARSISLEEINKGMCGGWDALIPPNIKKGKVPKGKRILEFTESKLHKQGVDTDNLMVYKPMFPSFRDPSKHPDGLCVPCCFTRPTTLGDSDWELRKNDKGNDEYYNNKTKKTSTIYPAKDMEYTNMYAPIGHSKHGMGPEYDLDANGNIIMDTIEGTRTLRESPLPGRKKIYNKCNQNEDIKELLVDDDDVTTVNDNPLLNAWPLNMGQTGYLSYPLQRFLGYNCREICQKSLGESQLKLNQPCLLHKGVEKHDTQSFISCIADWYSVAKNNAGDPRNGFLSDDISPTIKQIKNTMLNKLTIDTFIILQGGTLVDVFYKDDIQVDISLYTGSKLYNNLSSNDGGESKEPMSPESDIYFKRVISAFITFGEYILNDDNVIDYTYLWDLISLPSNLGGLFENGLNMIIINSPLDDITSKIQVVCPTNAYNDNIYDITRKTILIFSQNGYFEPIYKYTRTNKREYIIQKLFDFNAIKEQLPEMGSILTYIWSDIQTKCKPLPSIDVFKSMNFKEGISFDSIIKILEDSNATYKVRTQIVNFNSIVIGGAFATAVNPEEFIYIPCRPSAINNIIPYTFVHDSELLNTSSMTISKLKYIHKITKGKIPCKPILKIVTDGVIIGIVTETNQMVAVEPEAYQEDPVGVNVDDIKVIETNNVAEDFNKLDINLLTDKSKDVERMKKIKEIKIESKFYNIFRNLLRITFSYKKYKDDVNYIQELIKSPIELFHEKLSKIGYVVDTIMTKYIMFVEYDIDSIDSVLNLEQCINLDDDTCRDNTMCVISDGEVDQTDNICKILLPKTNLINGRNNEVEYFARIVNELINYPRIRTFIFNSTKFLSFQDAAYDLRDDEIILLEGLLYEGYFEDIVVDKQNNYIGNKTTWATTDPAKSLPFDSIFELSSKFKANRVNNCIVTLEKDRRLKKGVFDDMGFGDFDIMEFKNGINCSWQLMIDIISLHTKQTITENDVLKTLVDRYVELSKEEFDPKQQITFSDVLITMKAEGKLDQSNAIKKGTPIKDIIMSTNYYLTPIDFCIISHEYNIPIAIVCRTPITYLGQNYVSFNTDKATSCYVIFSGFYRGVNSKTSPIYGLFTKKNSPKLTIGHLGEQFNELIDNNYNTLLDYLLFSKKSYVTTIRKIGKRQRKKTYKDNVEEQKKPEEPQKKPEEPKKKPIIKKKQRIKIANPD